MTDDELKAALDIAQQIVDGRFTLRGHWSENLAMREVAKALLTQAERGREDDWRPIDSAPKDGTRFLAYGPDHYGDGSIMSVGYFNPWTSQGRTFYTFNTDAVSGWEYDEHLEEPSHWMPLPSAPVRSGQESGEKKDE